jgi:hypothetical protein
MPSIERLLRRWCERGGHRVVEVGAIAERLVRVSLPALGLLDVGYLESNGQLEGSGTDRTIRLSSRGRALVGGSPAPRPAGESSGFREPHVLSISTATRVADVLQLAPFVEVTSCRSTVDVLVTAALLVQAMGAGVTPEHVRACLERFAPLPDPLRHAIEHASVVVAHVPFVPAAGFVWIRDGAVRELLATKRATADAFVEPSPDGGLLVAAGVDIAKLVKRCRSVGVDLRVDAHALRAERAPRKGSNR